MNTHVATVLHHHYPVAEVEDIVQIVADRMVKPVKWGILGTANIGLEQVVPAMALGPSCDIVAIASQGSPRAQAAAAKLGIPRAYDSSEAMLADAEIEAVYNPLPNHLHVPVSVHAAESGKHVLCEKPIALTAAETETLIAARDRAGVLIAEAFMVRHHPQWRRVRDLFRGGAFGRLRAFQCAFSYYNDDPANIRNKADIGGGALYDIGVYPIVTARYLVGSEPRRVLGLIERDPTFGTDRLTSAMLDFADGQASFLCSTQLVDYQRVHVFGTKGRIEIEIPFNVPNDRATRIFLDDGAELGDRSATEERFDVTDLYRPQGEAFSRCVREGSSLEFPLEDSVLNMKVVDALFRSAEEDRWVGLGGD